MNKFKNIKFLIYLIIFTNQIKNYTINIFLFCFNYKLKMNKIYKKLII